MLPKIVCWTLSEAIKNGNKIHRVFSHIRVDSIGNPVEENALLDGSGISRLTIGSFPSWHTFNLQKQLKTVQFFTFFIEVGFFIESGIAPNHSLADAEPIHNYWRPKYTLEITFRYL